MNIKNSKKVVVRPKLQQITATFPELRYDMETINDEWLVHFNDPKNPENMNFVVEVSSVDDTINNFKMFYDGQWLIYSEESFEKIIVIAENKIKEIYG